MPKGKMPGALLAVSAALVLAAALLVAPAYTHPALPSASDEWQGLEGSKGYLEKTQCGYVFTLATPTQVPNATIAARGQDFVRIQEVRGQDTTSYIIPVSQITLRQKRAN